MDSPPFLRDHILKSLLPLPNTQTLGLTILASQPKRTRELFPYAVTPPKCLEQEWLVVLDSEAGGRNGNDMLPGCQSQQTEADSHATNIAEAAGVLESDSVKTEAPRVLISAISAHLYTFPSSYSSQSSSILYISKVDSSGYSPSIAPLPLTRHLIRSFLIFFLDRYPSLRIQLFGRAQRQYLFANSADGPGKKVLGGAGLCKWWKGVYEDTVSTWVSEGNEDEKRRKQDNVQLQFILPGYEEQEAKTLLGAGRPLPHEIAWTYSPPFITPIVPSSTTTPSLATLIPSLPDDPKTRFLEELVTSHPRPPSAASVSGNVKSREMSKKEKEAEDENMQRKFAHCALETVPVKEFWERMGFRQECASGDITGFFSLTSSVPDPSKEGGVTEERPEKEVKFLLPQTITSRLLTALTNLDFASQPLAVEGSTIWLNQTHSIVAGEVGESGWHGCIGRIEGKKDIKEPDVTRKERKGEEVVTMLQPRKKKKVS